MKQIICGLSLLTSRSFVRHTSNVAKVRSNVPGMHLISPEPSSDLKHVTNEAYKEAMIWWEQEKNRKLEALKKLELEKATGKHESTDMPTESIGMLPQKSIEHQTQLIKESLYRTDFDQTFAIEKNQNSPYLIHSWLKSREYKNLQRSAKSQHIYQDILHSTSLTSQIIAKYPAGCSQFGNVLPPTSTQLPPAIEIISCLPENALVSIAIFDADMPHVASATLKPFILQWISDFPAFQRDLSKHSFKTILPYIPPHPARGTGQHRICIVAYHQTQGPLATTEAAPFDRFSDIIQLTKSHQLNPIGLTFFRSQWDESVPGIYENILQTKEPIFVPPSKHLAKQKYIAKNKYT